MRALFRLVMVALVGGGVAVGAVVGAEWWREYQAQSDVEYERIDYNCGLPGCGNPWLLQEMIGPYGTNGCKWARETFGDYVGDCSERFPTAGWFWILADEDYGMLYLPVPVDHQGHARSTEDVYAYACRHPQLGGTGLRSMTAAEMEAAGESGDGWYVDDSPAPDARGNTYHLPGLSDETIDLMTIEGETGVCGSSREPRPAVRAPTTSSTTEPPPDRQRWVVWLRGHEIDERAPFWRETTGVRVAMRFDYKLRGEFTMERDAADAPWRVVSTLVTDSTIEITPLLEPASAWESKPFACTGCDAVHAMESFSVVPAGGGDVTVRWGNFQPSVNLEARIVADCVPQPGCDDWGTNLYVSETFFGRIGEHVLQLVDGHTVSEEVTSSQGATWVRYIVGLDLIEE